ncbi:MAG: prolipoprotein diacylglyceryl transferase family protein [Anaerolineae bacterium]
MPSSLTGLLQLNGHNVTLVLAIAVGLSALVVVVRAYGIDPGLAVDAALLALLAGIVAGRAEVVVANLDYFRERSLAEVVDPRIGGLGQRSLTAVGLLAYLAVVARQPRWRHYAAAVAPAAGLASAVAWAGFAFTGAAAGTSADLPLLVALPDQYGVVAPRFPLQFIMAGGHVLLAVAAVLLLNRASRPGVGFCLWAAAAAALSALLDNYRMEAVYIAAGIPRALVADCGLALFWLLAAAAMLRLGRRPQPFLPEAEAVEPAAQPDEAVADA